LTRSTGSPDAGTSWSYSQSAAHLAATGKRFRANALPSGIRVSRVVYTMQPGEKLFIKYLSYQDRSSIDRIGRKPCNVSKSNSGVAGGEFVVSV
jgi:hypothetical protein